MARKLKESAVVLLRRCDARTHVLAINTFVTNIAFSFVWRGIERGMCVALFSQIPGGRNLIVGSCGNAISQPARRQTADDDATTEIAGSETKARRSTDLNQALIRRHICTQHT